MSEVVFNLAAVAAIVEQAKREQDRENAGYVALAAEAKAAREALQETERALAAASADIAAFEAGDLELDDQAFLARLDEQRLFTARVRYRRTVLKQAEAAASAASYSLGWQKTAALERIRKEINGQAAAIIQHYAGILG